MTLRFLVVVLLLVGLTPFAEPQRKKTRPKKTVTTLKRDLRNLKDRKAALQRELKSTRRAAKAVLADIKEVDSRLESVSADLDRTTERLAAGKNEQADLSVKLKEATAQLDQKKMLVQRRIARNYVQGDGSALATLLRSEDIGDFASRRYMISRIADEDRRVFEDYKRLRADVSTKKNRQDVLVREIGNLARDQRAQQAGLKDARQEKGEYLGELRSKQDKIRSMLAQFEADEQNIAAQIAAYSRRPASQSHGPAPRFTGRFSRPVSARITSSFGNRYHPILHRTRLHAGVDFGASYGTTIKAAGDGIVISSGYMRGFGNVIILDNGDGFSTVYAHCSRLLVSRGERVKRGQAIGKVGATGLATGPHLHFEVRKNGRPVNPMGYL